MPSIAAQIGMLLQLLTEGGSRMSLLLNPGPSAEDIQRAQSALRVTFPAELCEYLTVLGNGVSDPPGSSRQIDSLLMQDFAILPIASSVAIWQEYSGTGVLGDDLFREAERLAVFPILTSGGEYVSCVWSAGSCSVVWKVTEWGYPSWRWPSLACFLSWLAECWQQGFLQFNEPEDEVIWNSEGTMSLYPKHKVLAIESKGAL